MSGILQGNQIGDPIPPADNRRWQRRNLLFSLTAVVVIGGVWNVVYAYYGEWPAVIVETVMLSLFGLGIYRLLRDDVLDRAWRLSRWIGILFCVAMSLALGGYKEAGGILWWILLTLVGSAVFDTERNARMVVAVCVVLGGLSILINPWVARPNQVPDTVMDLAMLTNFVAVSVIVSGSLRFYMRERNRALSLLHQEQERSEGLLLNVLPAPIAQRLKQTDQPIADQCEDVSVLFADVVGFTPMSEQLSPQESVAMLNQVFSHFDELAIHYGVEKIRTIGDGYMAAAGIPISRDDHAVALVDMALSMRAYMAARPAEAPPLQIRIGINSGAAVAGIIGTTKFHYDVWGDMVNVAARMESHGVPGQIQIARPTFEQVQAHFVCEPRGTIQVKGKGEMETWFVTGRLSA